MTSPSSVPLRSQTLQYDRSERLLNKRQRWPGRETGLTKKQTSSADVGTGDDGNKSGNKAQNDQNFFIPEAYVRRDEEAKPRHKKAEHCDSSSR